MPAEYLLLETGDHLLLETGDDLLLESSTVDDSIALPLIDDSSVYAPAAFGAQQILLPLINEGDTFPPDAFEDKTLDLPAIDGSAVYAPAVDLVGLVSIPLIDDGAIFAPSVFVEQQADLPLIDDAELFAPSFAQAQQLDLRFLDGGWPLAPMVTGQVVSSLAVYVGDTMLEPVTTPTFRDPLDDIGSFTVTLANDDPDLALCDFDAVLRFEVDGRPVFSGVIETREIVHLAAGEEHDHVTALSGPGFLGIGSRDVVYPSRGVRSVPIEEVRSFSWVSPDFDHSTWPFAKKINRQRSYAYFDGAFVGSAGPVPHIWPDTEGWWIWANRADCTALNAPPGTCLFRRSFTLATAQTVRFFAAFDNLGTFYVDGAKIADFFGFLEGEYADIEMSAGEHVIAASVRNVDPDGFYNPGGFIAAAISVRGNGLLGDMITHTDHTWRCLPYVTNPPGFTPGEVLYLTRDETDIYDGVDFGFTETLDADGRPWTSYSEITVRVGRTYLEMQREMAGSLIDIAAAPGGPVIRAWEKGTRGTTRSASLDQTPGDPDASEFLQLRHTGHRARVNKALIRYAGGWDETFASSSSGTRGALIELGPVGSRTEARRIASQIMARRAEPAYSTSARILPSDDGPQPYRDFEPGDTITCLDETGSLASMRVTGISLDPDEVGVLEWGIELRDIELDLEELHQNWLRRAADGQAVGGARVTGPAGSPPPSAARINALDVAEFSTHTPGSEIPTGLGILRRAAKSGNVVEIVASLTQPGSTATMLRVLLNGAVLGGTLTIPAGSDEAEIPVARVAVRANIDRLQPEVISAGSGAEGLDIQVRAL